MAKIYTAVGNFFNKTITQPMELQGIIADLKTADKKEWLKTYTGSPYQPRLIKQHLKEQRELTRGPTLTLQEKSYKDEAKAKQRGRHAQQLQLEEQQQNDQIAEAAAHRIAAAAEASDARLQEWEDDLERRIADEQRNFDEARVLREAAEGLGKSKRKRKRKLRKRNEKATKKKRKKTRRRKRRQSKKRY